MGSSNAFLSLLTGPVASAISIAAGLLGLGVGVFGVALALREARLSRKSLVYSNINFRSSTSSKGFLRISTEHEVYFFPERKKDVTVTRIGVRNEGKEPIVRDDLTTDLLRATFYNSATVLEARVVYTSSAANNFNVHFSNGTVFLEFDFLNGLDGAVIQIVHTGPIDTYVELEGKIKGTLAPQWRTPEVFTPDRGHLLLVLWFGALYALQTFMSIAVGVYAFRNHWPLVNGVLAVSGTFLTLGATASWTGRRWSRRLDKNRRWLALYAGGLEWQEEWLDPELRTDPNWRRKCERNGIKPSRWEF